MQVKQLQVQTHNLHTHLYSQITNSAWLQTLLMKLKPYEYKPNDVCYYTCALINFPFQVLHTNSTFYLK